MKEGFEGDVDIADVFTGKLFFIFPGDAPWSVFQAHIVEVIAQCFCVDSSDVFILVIFQPDLQMTLVAIDGARAKALGCFELNPGMARSMVNPRYEPFFHEIWLLWNLTSLTIFGSYKILHFGRP